MTVNQLIVDERLHPETASKESVDNSYEDTIDGDNPSEGPSTDLRLPTDSFDWKRGWFRDEGMPLWLKLLLQFLLALLMVSAPPIISYVKLVKDAYPLISLLPPVQPSALMEGLRAVWLFGAAFMVYFGIQLFLCIVPYVTFKMAELRCMVVEDAVRQSIEQSWSIREYFGLAGAGFALAVVSKVLYPEPPEIVDAAKAVAGAVIDIKAADLVKGVIKIPDIIAVGKNMEDYFNRSCQFFVTRGCLAFAVIACLILAEKLILKAITHRYQSHSLEERIANNKFARKVMQNLKKCILRSSDKRKKNECKRKIGELIYEFMGKTKVNSDSFTPYMDSEVALRFFGILDPDHLGVLNRSQLLAAVDAVYVERGSIDRAFIEQCCILGKFDNLLMAIVWLISSLILMIVMDPPIRFLITLCITVIGGLMFMFQSTAKQAFESIVFVIFTHPFDRDDWVIIKDHLYLVHEVGLWASIFITSDGKLCYMSNKMLASLPITNLRRSPLMNEKILVCVTPATTQERLQALESKLIHWLKQHDKEFVPSLMIRDLKIVDKDHMRIEIPLSHKFNFNDMEKKDLRTRKFMLYLRDCIHDLGIELSPPLRA